MGQYDEVCLEYFLANQSQLLDKTVARMSNEELEDASEVFSLPDGRFLVVEV